MGFVIRAVVRTHTQTPFFSLTLLQSTLYGLFISLSRSTRARETDLAVLLLSQNKQKCTYVYISLIPSQLGGNRRAAHSHVVINRRRLREMSPR